MSSQLAEQLERLDALPEQARDLFSQATDDSELNRVKARFVGKKGVLRQIMRQLRDLPPADRPRLGKAINAAQEAVQSLLEARRDDLRRERLEAELSETWVDLTVPARHAGTGGLHPLRRIHRQIVDIFRLMGYDVATGPEVETDFNNFEALNFPPDHPARDMQDTLLLANGHLLRTHTSPVQIRTMLANRPPIRIIAPGTVYRCDADVTHSPMFSQVEGLLVDRGVNIGHLKGTLEAFVHRLYGPDVPVRLRPSFFPFTEPSVEVDIGCVFCPEVGHCRVCGGTGWMEILGAGMVDPNVFEATGIDPETYTGFAFGMGIERICMLKYGISDIRLLFENDVRFLRQFA